MSTEQFDPYYEWLGIRPKDQPANHYRLLGVELFEDSAQVIENAADSRTAHLRTYQTGKHSAQSQKLLNEVAAARLCLLKPDRKAAYDAQLWAKLASQPAPSEKAPPEKVAAAKVAAGSGSGIAHAPKRLVRAEALPAPAPHNRLTTNGTPAFPAFELPAQAPRSHSSRPQQPIWKNPFVLAGAGGAVAVAVVVAIVIAVMGNQPGPQPKGPVAIGRPGAAPSQPNANPRVGQGANENANPVTDPPRQPMNPAQVDKPENPAKVNGSAPSSGAPALDSSPIGSPSAAPASRDREAAAWVIKAGGRVGILPLGATQPQYVKTLEELPQDTFVVYSVIMGEQNKEVPEGWQALSGLTALQHLSVMNLPAGDKEITQIAQAPQLQMVNLMGTSIGDGTLEHMARFGKLNQLTLTRTKITDEGLAHLAGTKLMMLTLDDTAISDEGLRHVGTIKTLNSLSLGNTRVTDKGIGHFGSLRLGQIQLSGTQVSGQGVGELVRLQPNISSINLGRMQITADAAANLKGFRQLRFLDLSGARVDDAAWPELVTLVQEGSLENLHLQNVKIGDHGVESLCSMPRVKFLTVYNTGLSAQQKAKLRDSLKGTRILGGEGNN